ncbi:hypothetical protein LSH36_1012g00006, partial [Paralvinella palmiformis]
ARELHHENINPFIGLCIDQPHTCIVTSYAARGSLEGMEYLHSSPVGSHGRLKSSNCVVDNRWVCKVTDFGLDQLRSKERWADEHRRYSGNQLPVSRPQ